MCFKGRRALRVFVILTACRSCEARNMRWEALDLDNAIWTIPAERMKALVTHRVPLSHQALILLKRCKVCAGNGYSHHRISKYHSPIRLFQPLEAFGASSTTPGRMATARGFRSRFRDWCSEQAYARVLAERAQAHTVQNKIEAAYHRTNLLDQRRQMIGEWAEFVSNSSNAA